MLKIFKLKKLYCHLEKKKEMLSRETLLERNIIKNSKILNWLKKIRKLSSI